MPLTRDENGTINRVVLAVWIAILAVWVVAIWRLAHFISWPWLLVILPGWGLTWAFAGAVIAARVGSALEAARERRREQDDPGSIEATVKWRREREVLEVEV